MNIHITIHPNTDVIEFVTAEANGPTEGKALLAKLVPVHTPEPPEPLKVEKKPSACSLREAAELFRQMSVIGLPTASKVEECCALAELLDQLANGNKKIQAIKAMRVFSGLGLKDTKRLIEQIGVFAIRRNPSELPTLR